MFRHTKVTDQEKYCAIKSKLQFCMMGSHPEIRFRTDHRTPVQSREFDCVVPSVGVPGRKVRLTEDAAHYASNSFVPNERDQLCF